MNLDTFFDCQRLRVRQALVPTYVGPVTLPKRRKAPPVASCRVQAAIVRNLGRDVDDDAPAPPCRCGRYKDRRSLRCRTCQHALGWTKQEQAKCACGRQRTRTKRRCQVCIAAGRGSKRGVGRDGGRVATRTLETGAPSARFSDRSGKTPSLPFEVLEVLHAAI